MLKIAIWNFRVFPLKKMLMLEFIAVSFQDFAVIFLFNKGKTEGILYKICALEVPMANFQIFSHRSIVPFKKLLNDLNY